MIDWISILKKINYQFNSLGCLSGESIKHPIYGKLNFTWYGNKYRIDIHFSDTCVNCICAETKINCMCSFLAFKEKNHTDFNTKSFSKAEVKKTLKKLKP